MYLKIGVIGEQCSGKSTAAKFLIDEYKHSYLHKFADPIYEILRIFNKDKNRAFMQEMGDVAKKYWGRNIYAELFADAIKEREEEIICLDSLTDRKMKDTLIVCDDIRYPFELDTCRTLGFHIISIFCPHT